MRPLILCLVLIVGPVAAGAQIKSVYTDLVDVKCKTLELTDDEGGSYKGECKGAGEYKLQVLEGDLRQSVTVVNANGKEHPLNFWEYFGGFSAVGDKAEWRVKNGKPVALIVRLNVADDPEDFNERTSFLIVVKLTKGEICVTDVLQPTRSQNLEARRSADRSATRACRKQAE